MNIVHHPVSIPVSNEVSIQGDLNAPMSDGGPLGVVIFAHGSGSGRFSPRNKFVADVLNNSGLATLLIDLLTPEEEEIDNVSRHLRFDVNMLSDRLVACMRWTKTQTKVPIINNLPIGLFGASTGGGAALIASAKVKGETSAVVSRGGRPDLAEKFLKEVTCPTLLLVGGRDTTVIKLNEKAYNQMENCSEKKLDIIPGATHLFEEKGALEDVAKRAAEWFKEYLRSNISKV